MGGGGGVARDDPTAKGQTISLLCHSLLLRGWSGLVSFIPFGLVVLQGSFDGILCKHYREGKYLCPKTITPLRPYGYNPCPYKALPHLDHLVLNWGPNLINSPSAKNFQIPFFLAHNLGDSNPNLCYGPQLKTAVWAIAIVKVWSTLMSLCLHINKSGATHNFCPPPPPPPPPPPFQCALT